MIWLWQRFVLLKYLEYDDCGYLISKERHRMAILMNTETFIFFIFKFTDSQK